MKSEWMHEYNFLGMDYIASLNEEENIEYGCDFALCVEPGDGYEKNKIYPILGWNNGVHICRKGNNGDVHDGEFMTGGTKGCKGLFNDMDGKGTPSFVPVVVRKPVNIKKVKAVQEYFYMNIPILKN